MSLGRRVAALERARGGPGGPSRCPGSVVVRANDDRMNPLPLPPPRACPRCGAVVRRILLRNVAAPVAPGLRRPPPGGAGP